MIAGILLLAAGVLLAAVAVLLRKKMTGAWKVSLLATGILVLAVGGGVLGVKLSQTAQAKEDAYIGLSYLQKPDLDSASFYLNKSSTEESFAACAGRYLIAKMQGSDFIADLNLSVAKDAAKSSEEKKIAEVLPNVQVNDQEDCTRHIQRLCDSLKLSNKKIEKLNRYMEAEIYGYFSSEEEAAAAGFNEKDQMRMEVSAALKNQNLNQAVWLSANLADQYPSAKNRLLLAETVAEMTYAQNPMEPELFQTQLGQDGNVPNDASIQKERQTLELELQSLESKRLELENQIQLASEEEKQSLREKHSTLQQTEKEVQKKLDHIYVFRAFNSIADIHTVEAKIVRARLYFAMQDYEKAVECLLDAANSPSVKLNPKNKLSGSLNKIVQAYEGDTVVYETTGFQQTVQNVLTAPFEDLIGVSSAPLTEAFAGRVTSDQRQYVQGLTVTQVDTSAFPQVTVSLSGEEKALEEIVKGKAEISRDTGEDIQYTAKMDENEVTNLCIVADCSGSMDGEPLMMLKQAINDFVNRKKPGAMVSLVAFDNDGRVVTPMTSDVGQLMAGADSLEISGGTSIGAGLEKGMEALAEVGGNSTILLMSDGESSLDYSILDEAASRGIAIYTVGFGGVNDQLMGEIASRTGGIYLKAEELGELVNIFAGIQDLTGSVLQVSYTVSNPDVIPMRYFFVKTKQYSVRKDYQVSQVEPQPQLFSCEPSILDTEEQAVNAEADWQIKLTLRGSLLSTVESVTVDGKEMTIERHSDEQIQLLGPALPDDGWKPIQLTFSDGNTLTWDRLLRAGAVEQIDEIRIGNLLVENAAAIRLENGKLLLGQNGYRQMNLANFQPVQGSELDAVLYGLLLLPPPPEPLEDNLFQVILDYGETGEVLGSGTLMLERYDAALMMENVYPSAVEQFRLDCSAGQVKVNEITEGSEWIDALS